MSEDMESVEVVRFVKECGEEGICFGVVEMASYVFHLVDV